MIRSRNSRVWGHAVIFAWSDLNVDRSRKLVGPFRATALCTGCPPSQGAVWRVLCGGRECDRSSDAGEDEAPAPARTGRTSDRVLDLLLCCGRLGRGAGGDWRRRCLGAPLPYSTAAPLKGALIGAMLAAGAEFGDADIGCGP